MSGTGLVENAVQVPPEGRLEGNSIPELVWDLHRARHSGALLVERQGIRKVLYFRDGRVVFAASTDPEDRLGAFLFRRGEVDLAPLIEAGGEVAHGRRLGQILVEAGLMDKIALVRAVLDHVREIALSVFPWNEGRWRLSRACLPSEEAITLDVPTEELVLAGVRRVREGGRVRRAVGGPRAVYRVMPGARADIAGLGMTERAILDELHRPSRVDTLCGEIFAPSEVVYRSLWALSILGLVERVPRQVVRRPGGAPEPGTNEGHLEHCGGASDLLLALGDARLTGAVRLFRGGIEATIFLRDGQVEFARTNDSELSLAAHLLRRGVISDTDRDEAARRLNTGKRIGTLLAEQGALDFQDLRRFVREQVLEVVKRLVLWTEGEYTIEEGETVEEQIVVGKSPEDMIMAAYESLDACERIWSELGGLDTVYRLRPEYLQRLDKMTLRPGVWELVSLLGHERTVRELTEGRPEPDFEVCRWLCGLNRVRIVERREAGEIAPRPGATGAVRLVEEAVLAPTDADLSERDPLTAADIAPELFCSTSLPEPLAAKPYDAEVDGQDAAEPTVYEIDEPTGGWAEEPVLEVPADPEPGVDADADAVREIEPPAAVMDELPVPREPVPVAQCSAAFELDNDAAVDEAALDVDGSPDVVAAWDAAEMKRPATVETVAPAAGIPGEVEAAVEVPAAVETAIEVEPATDVPTDVESAVAVEPAADVTFGVEPAVETAFETAAAVDADAPPDVAVEVASVPDAVADAAPEVEAAVLPADNAPSEIEPAREEPAGAEPEPVADVDEDGMPAADVSSGAAESVNAEPAETTLVAALAGVPVRPVFVPEPEPGLDIPADPLPADGPVADAIDADLVLSAAITGAHEIVPAAFEPFASTSRLLAGNDRNDEVDAQGGGLAATATDADEDRIGDVDGQTSGPSAAATVSTAPQAIPWFHGLEVPATPVREPATPVAWQVVEPAAPAESASPWSLDPPAEVPAPPSETDWTFPQPRGEAKVEARPETATPVDEARPADPVPAATPDADDEPDVELDLVPSEPVVPETGGPEPWQDSGPQPPAAVTTLEVPRAGHAPHPAVVVPPEILAAVDRFNRRHQVVFDGLRREIGAGVRNFVLTCEKRLGAAGAPFEGLAPDRDGLFPRQALAEALLEHPADAAHDPLEALINQELAFVRNLLEPRMITAIEDALADA